MAVCSVGVVRTCFFRNTPSMGRQKCEAGEALGPRQKLILFETSLRFDLIVFLFFLLAVDIVG